MTSTTHERIIATRNSSTPAQPYRIDYTHPSRVATMTRVDYVKRLTI